ncbi:MAG TPA: helix-turn-helix domain-containing protein [Gammaproteobacteria bacterium]|nr:helix-turn-helix domain-containing protein [Gammaproteobacteria bacterium]
MTEPTLLPIEESGTPQTAVTGPGRRLREAREAQKLSVSKVANLLHLDPRLVGALEHNDYDHLPEPIYVTGYLRNYARLLDIPEEDVVSSYQQLDIPPPPILSDLTRNTQRHTPLNHMLIQWGAVGLVGIGLVLVSWHMSTGQPPPARPAGGDAPAAVKAAVPPGPTGSAGQAAAPAADGSAAPKGDAVALSDHPPGGPDGAAAGARPPAPSVETAPRTPPPAAAHASAPTAVIAPASPDAAPAPHDGAASQQSASAGAVTVVLRFNHDSWVEVTDATGQRVFFDLGKAGDTRTIHGAPPFKVLLGYSPGVSIEYNGKPFDQSSFTGHNNVARFTMGSNN